MNNIFDAKEFGERLRRYRKERGWTQTELMNKSSIGFSMVRDYEHGRHIPRIDSVLLLANALGVSPHDLLGWNDI